ncbi:MAG: addiction module protein [Pyrinomonadaceae bacterium]
MNAEVVLPLDSMTVAEKLDVVERIMEDLSRNSASVPAIDWHGDVLRRRAENLANGSDRLVGLDEAETLIRKKTGRQ